jgi:hypothetical protein
MRNSQVYWSREGNTWKFLTFKPSGSIYDKEFYRLSHRVSFKKWSKFWKNQDKTQNWEKDLQHIFDYFCFLRVSEWLILGGTEL